MLINWVSVFKAEPVESQPIGAKTAKMLQKKIKPSSPLSGEILYQDISLSPTEVETATRLLSSKVSSSLKLTIRVII